MATDQVQHLSTSVPGEPGIVSDRIAKFSMVGVPLLSEGSTTQPLVMGENLFLMSKVYAGGGENTLHAHRNDDHAFFVLAGRARFYDQSGEPTELGPLEGILIPRGVYYRFESVPAENLVMLRMAAAEVDYFTLRQIEKRVAPDGSSLSSKDPRSRPGKAGLPPRHSGQLFGSAVK